VQQRLSEIHAAVANIRIPDVAPIQQRLGEVQTAIAGIPQPNLKPLQTSLADLEAFVVALDKPPQDLAPLFNRLSSLDAALATLQTDVREAQALKPIDRRLAGIEEAIGSMPGPDLSPVLGAVRSIDSRHDLVAMENRLTAIEYGLAAVHHMLRSRADALVQRADASDARIAPPLHVVRQPEPQPAPVRPDRETDPINAFRRANDEANLLSEPAFGPPDDLEAIDGVGPMLRALLHDLGVYYFWQVAEWSPQEIDWVESKLMHFRGRIRRDDWVGHARALALGPSASKRPSQARAKGAAGY
jgi:predicted flap endonuclease-1-like 5' DNA nuclease